VFDYVEADRFYQDDGDKVNINWYCYEYANLLYMSIRASARLSRHRAKRTQEQIVSFCVYFAKRMRKSVLGAQIQKTGGVTVNSSYVYEFYPDIGEKEADLLLGAATEAWNEQAVSCAGCPSQCLADSYGRTPKFDRLRETGWPT
jgi:hypothetical protein